MHIISQFWNPKVQNKVVGRTALSAKIWGESIPCAFQLLETVIIPCSCTTPVSLSTQPFPLCVSIKTDVIGFRAHPDNPGLSHLMIFNLTTLINMLFPKMVTFTSSRIWTYLFRGHHLIYHKQNFCILSFAVWIWESFLKFNLGCFPQAFL